MRERNAVMKKQLIASLLLLSLLLPMLFASCSEGGAADESASVEPAPADAAPTAETEPETEADVLAALGEHDFGGENFVVLCRTIQDSDTFNEVDIESDGGDIVDDAIFRRNAELNERYNVKIEALRTNGNWPARDNFLTVMKKSVMASDGAFDLILGYQAYMSTVDVMECLCNFLEVDGIDLDADYYYRDIIRESTLNDKLYYLAGDFTYSVWPSMLVYFFNKGMAESYNLEDLYSLVREGKWTLDKLMELSTGVYVDQNGDGAKDKSDSFGFATDFGNIADAYYAAFDIKLTVRDDAGVPQMNRNLEKLDAVITKLYTFEHDTNDVYTFVMMSNMTDNPLADIFVDNRALFYPERLKSAIDFRGIEMNFGILPYPKWDESQSIYHSQAWNGYSVMAIPKDARNLEKTAVMTGALNAASKQQVIPAFYDKALKVKFTRDEESADMLDIIRDGISFQFGYFYSQTINDGCNPWRIRDILNSGESITRVYRQYSRKLEKNLGVLLDFFYGANE